MGYFENNGAYKKILHPLLIGGVFLTPLLYTYTTKELFEFPKMHLIYLLSITASLIYFIGKRGLRGIRIIRTPLNIGIAIYLFSYFISTIYSSDIYTSVFGYYTRFNGGFLSVMAFMALYYILVDELNNNIKLFKEIIISMSLSLFAVSIFGIGQHFGFQKGLWVQDSSARVFASLGQPNWLAAWLVMLLPLVTTLFLTTKNKLKKSFFFVVSVAAFLALWFTYSISGIVGAFVSGLLFLKINSREWVFSKAKQLLIIFLLFVVVSLTFPGIFKPRVESLIKQLKTATVAIYAAEIATSYEGDTFSIRKIVWRGGLKTFLSSGKTMLIGTGPETFAYNFLPFRPRELNSTSEWDFLYNKAHNEFIDILVTRGSIGLIAYIILITQFCYQIAMYIRNRSQDNLSSPINNKHRYTPLVVSLLCGVIGLLVTNIFGWTTVTTSLSFWLFLACCQDIKGIWKNNEEDLFEQQ